MFKKSLLLIGSSPAALDCDLVAKTLDAWSGDQVPTIERTTFDAVLADADELNFAGAAWVISDQAKNTDLHEIVAWLQDKNLPAALTLPDETKPGGATCQSGVVVVPTDCEPGVALAVMRTLWSQATVIFAMRQEVALLSAHHGGLCNQIDKINEELRMAAQLQREFLSTDLPDYHGVQFRVLFRPAGYVSGDIYDVARLDEHHVGVFVADAVGHGVPAALLTVFIKRSLHTKRTNPNRPEDVIIVSPNEVLERLNRDMIRQQESSENLRFATATYGVIDLRTRQLSLARAGHPAPILMRSDGSIQNLEPDGGLLGIFPDEQYELIRLQLQDSDRLLMYSDGFEFAFPEDEQATTHYTKKLAQLRDGTIDEAIQRLAGRLDQQIGSLNQIDDLTAVIVDIAAAQGSSAAQDGPGARIDHTRRVA